MPFDGKLLASARAELEKIKASNQAEQQCRQTEVYYKIPEIREIDSAMKAQMAQLFRLSLSRRPDLSELLDKLKNDNLDMQIRKAELLTEHGYPGDYLNDIYSCPKCRDTGTYNNSVCSCLVKLYNFELTKELGVLLKNGSESFQSFDLSLYSDRYDPKANVVPREQMKIVFSACKIFADNFPRVSSLLLHGDTGLGKTYLSACIARTIAEKGYSVCYDTSASALEAFERQKFSRDPEELEKAGAKVSRMLSCDLMILDDLGTEMVTPMSISALYTLINTRLVNSKPTIVSTNLRPNELESKYSSQIASRIIGEYLDLPFAGADIRQILKNR